MNIYNDNWTRENFIEYRKLKRSGYDDEMLKEHFGEDIYHSGMYNKNAHIIPYDYYVKCFENRLNEIKINPAYTPYNVVPQPSTFIKSKTDYIIHFNCDYIEYIICLMFYPINNINTYNIIFTTKEQWNEYNNKVKLLSLKGYLTDDERNKLNNIIGKQTNLNQLFPIFKSISWIIMDYCERYLKGELLSIGDTDNEIKINLYRNIIKDSFPNIKEKDVMFNDNKYFTYDIV